MLKNTYLSEEKVLQKLEELKFIRKPFTHAGNPFPLVQWYQIPQELIKKKKYWESKKDGG